MPDYEKIWGTNSSLTPHEFSDSEYLKGWESVGNTPPARQMFDALQQLNDQKAKDLNDRMSPLESKAEADGRQAATEYAEGVMVTADGLPNGWLLECIVPGTTGTGALVIPSPLVIGGTIIDGTVTWKLLNIALSGIPVGYITPFLQSTAPDGWLSCSGAEVSRAAYPDLWNFVNGSSQLISESDWQAKNTAGEKNIGWFSSGDGESTFRLPRIVGSGELTEVKRFTTAGEGSFVASVTGIYKITLQGAGGGGGGAGVTSDAGSRGGGGGGAGGYGVFYEMLTAGTSYSYTIGAGGAGGTGYTSNAPATGGGKGGDSSITINNNAYVATGGAGARGGEGYVYSNAGTGGYFKINNTVYSQSQAGNPGNQLSNYWAIGGTGGGVGGTAAPNNNDGGSTYAGSGGGGGIMRNSSIGWKGADGGDGYIEFSFNPVPQYWYVRAFGSATNQGTIDITELANMLNDKADIDEVLPLFGGGALTGNNLTWNGADLGGSAIVAKSLGSTSSYIKYASGLIVQWGEAWASGTGDFTMTLPISFTTACRGLAMLRGSQVNSYTRCECVASFGTTQVTFSRTLSWGIDWIAIGY